MNTFLQYPAIKPAFHELVQDATTIDIAVAWATDCDELKLILARANSGRCKVRLIVGLDGNSTDPDALDEITGSKAMLRVARNTRGGVFHPKFYQFKKGGTSTCLVGSSNLSLGGFDKNHELMVRFEDSAKAAAAWYDGLWSEFKDDPTAAIDFYKKRYVPPMYGPRSTSNSKPVSRRSPVKLLMGAPLSWSEYVAALREADAFWERQSSTFDTPFSVLGETFSWMHTLRVGREICMSSRWDSLSPDQCEVLMPSIKNPRSGLWGLLGSMGSAATARSQFINDGATRTEIRRYLAPAMKATDEKQFTARAAQVIGEISAIERFGSGVATRLLALARPDMAISVNNGCVTNLRQVVQDLPKTTHVIGNSKNYPKLLNWIYQQPWYRSTRPKDLFEQAIWDQRVALIDCFLYRVSEAD